MNLIVILDYESNKSFVIKFNKLKSCFETFKVFCFQNYNYIDEKFL